MPKGMMPYVFVHMEMVHGTATLEQPWFSGCGLIGGFQHGGIRYVSRGEMREYSGSGCPIRMRSGVMSHSYSGWEYRLCKEGGGEYE